MPLSLTGRQIDITPALRQLVQRRLARLERKLGDAIVSTQVVLGREKYRYIADLTVHARGDHILHGIGSTVSWSTSLTAAVEKVMRQADRVKGKWQVRKRGAVAARRPVRAARSRPRV
jgi:putative sigma-54 modulation protein